MRIELQIQNLPVRFVAINDITAKSDQEGLVKACSFPLFQDTEKMQAWLHHHGHKDDFYIYDKQGKLLLYVPSGGSQSTDLSTPEGYNFIKNKLLEFTKR